MNFSFLLTRTRPGVIVLLIACIVLSPFLPLALLPAQAAPDDPIPSPVLDPNSVSWASLRNRTSAQFSDDFDKYSKQGLMMLDIEVDEIDGVQRVGGVWQKNTDGRGWYELRNLTASQFIVTNADMRSKNFRMIDQEVYILGAAAFYAGVWVENKEKLDWINSLDLTSADFGTEFDRHSAAGFMMIDIDIRQTSQGLRYSAVWVKNSENLLWQEWRNLTSAEFGAKFDELRDRYRVIDVESYQSGGVQYYAGIWVQNKNGRGWASWRDMTAKEFGDKWLQLRDAGYRLINYEAYPVGRSWRYAGVWRQNSSRPNWRFKNQVDALLNEHFETYDIPGMSVAIAHNGQWVYLRGFGYADLDDQVIAHSRTIYRLASISKAVTGVLGLRLQEQGSMDLGLTTRTYVPALPVFHTHVITESLANRSGIGHYDQLGSLNGHYATALDATMDLMDEPLVFAPGTGYLYSTHAYTFAAAAMEDASGDTVTELINNRLSQPFGLSSLQAEDRSVPNKYRSLLYNANNDEVSADDQSWKIGGGGMESSVYDLVRFGVKLVSGTILTAGSLDEMWTPPDNFSNYALGWSTGVDLGQTVVAKDGANNGARSYLRIYPDSELVIAVLTNRKSGGHSPVTLGREIGKIVLGSAASLAESEVLAMDAIDDVLEPDEEAIDPALEVVPISKPVAAPQPADLVEPADEPINMPKLYLPLLRKN